MTCSILIGSSIAIREVDEPGQWMEWVKIRGLLSSAFDAIKDHLIKTHFKDYSILPAYACDIDSAGMILQRLQANNCTADGLFADVGSISRYIEGLADDVRHNEKDQSWLADASSRVYAFGIIDGFDPCILNSLLSSSGVDDGNRLTSFDYKSLASLLNCRPLACKLEKCGLDIGMEVYLAFRSGEWLYFGYDEVYQEGLVICEHEVGFNSSTSQLLDALTRAHLDKTSA
jgi:hypothetical protein